MINLYLCLPYRILFIKKCAKIIITIMIMITILSDRHEMYLGILNKLLLIKRLILQHTNMCEKYFNNIITNNSMRKR